MFCGNDDITLPLLSLGSQRGYLSLGQYYAGLPSDGHGYLEGRREQARKAQLKYLDLINGLFMEVNPIPVKEAMNLMGMDVGGYRLPLCPMSSEHEKTGRNDETGRAENKIKANGCKGGIRENLDCRIWKNGAYGRRDGPAEGPGDSGRASSSDAGELQTLEKADVAVDFLPSGHAGTVGGLTSAAQAHRFMLRAPTG